MDGRVDYRVISPGGDALVEPEDVLDCGNSGTTARLVAGVLAGRPLFAVLDGDASLRRRPMGRIVEPLRLMGAGSPAGPAVTLLPLAITGRAALTPIHYDTPVPSAQVKSAILLAALPPTARRRSPRRSRPATTPNACCAPAASPSTRAPTPTARSAPPVPARRLPRHHRRGRRPGSGRTRRPSRSSATAPAAPASTSPPATAPHGTFGLYRWTFGPDESGPDPHFHRSITESFYVLSGEVSLYDGTGWKTGRPGDFFHVPEGGLHGFRGANHSSMLLMFTPGRAARGLLRDARRAGRAPMTEEERVEFMLRHDTYWV